MYYHFHPKHSFPTGKLLLCSEWCRGVTAPAAGGASGGSLLPMPGVLRGVAAPGGSLLPVPGVPGGVAAPAAGGASGVSRLCPRHRLAQCQLNPAVCPWYCSTTAPLRASFQRICKQQQTSSRKDSFSHAILYSALLFLRLFEKAISTQNMYISTIYIFHTLNLNVFLYLQLRIFCSGRSKVNLKKVSKLWLILHCWEEV